MFFPPLRIFTNLFMLDHVIETKRWEGRCASRWRKWKKVIESDVPSEKILFDESRNIFYCHPIMERRIASIINKE